MKLSRSVQIAAIALVLTAGGAPAMAADAVSAPVVPAVRNASPAPADDGNDSMPGMDMPAQDMPTEDSPAQDMPGMDMPAEDMPAPADEHTESVPRPRGLLIGSFVGINAAVLLAASVLRRRTRAERNHPRPPRASAVTAR